MIEILTLYGMEKLLKMKRNNMNLRKKKQNFPSNWENMVKNYLLLKKDLQKIYNKNSRHYQIQNRAYYRGIKIAEILGVNICQ
jgi:hypothetical protein